MRPDRSLNQSGDEPPLAQVWRMRYIFTSLGLANLINHWRLYGICNIFA